MNYKLYFKDKKITMMGLGLLGRGLNDALFLAECGAKLTITDLKSAEDLKDSLKKLEKIPGVRFTLGIHRVEDFKNADMILKSASVPLESEFISTAERHGVPVEMDESLFMKMAPGVKVIGITGTRGKTTTTMMIYEMLLHAKKKLKWKHSIFLGGNIRGLATLPLLKKVKAGDVVVLELSSWQLQGFGDSKISPHISVFTNFYDDHLNYYKNDRELYFKDKSYIFRNQKAGDYFIAPVDLLKRAQTECPNLKTNFVIPKTFPASWKLSIAGVHNVHNAELAKSVGEVLDIPESIIKEALFKFKGVEGRMQKIATRKGVNIYNDTTATSPEAFESAVTALGDKKKRNIVLIMGGADKSFDLAKVVDLIPKYIKSVVLLSGKNTTGSDKIRPLLKDIPDLEVQDANTLKDAVNLALQKAVSGDTLLFCPVFASFGMFKNEYDRGDQFDALVKKLILKRLK